MLELKIQGAAYAETDLPLFNSEGALRVRRAVETAQQARTLATNNEELRGATAKLQMARELSHTEHRLAERNFEIERQRCFETISNIRDRFLSSIMPKLDKMQFENQLGASITCFYRKDFVRARRLALDALKALKPQPRPEALVPGRRNPMPRATAMSTTALYQKGLLLETKRRAPEAVECYAEILERNPEHMLALGRLRGLSAHVHKGGF